MARPNNDKSSSSYSSATTTIASNARETVRISAKLASSPCHSCVSSSNFLAKLGVEEPLLLDSSLKSICCEEVDGLRWRYVAQLHPHSSPPRFINGSLQAISLHSPQSPLHQFMSFVKSYVVPDGYPHTVPPSYVPFMTWRALKHFFGGAMGVFTTRTLLSSVGVSGNTATSGAVAINWVLKDGAGRVGKMIFARQGRKFDYDLKQLRFVGDLLMELGAGVELVTAAVPHLFLPLACAANVTKSVAAMTLTATRTPIYKAFAKGENIGDVTSKGECVGNIADLLGTTLSIMMSKRNPSLVTTFSLLSCGYVLSSYQEVKSVVLQTLNRARFEVAVDSFLKRGCIPSLEEGNMKEDIFSVPWLKEGPIVLGPRFKDAFQDPGEYLAIEPLFEKESYLVTYNPSKGKVYALLKNQAQSDDILKATFHAHVLLHFIHSSSENQSLSSKQQEHAHIDTHIAESCKMVSASYGIFKTKAAEQGWKMSDSHLNSGRVRLC